MYSRLQTCLSPVLLAAVTALFTLRACPPQSDVLQLAQGPRGPGVANSKTALCTAEQYFVACIYHISFVRSFISEHSGGFHILATADNAAVNIGVRVSSQIRVFISGGG